ncbi:Hypothetical protein POVR1_LOCUS44 [uncultured virus]|nr:Hypothetical protein POVR1_LOCUS44 [uncultured virus]
MEMEYSPGLPPVTTYPVASTGAGNWIAIIIAVIALIAVIIVIVVVIAFRPVTPNGIIPSRRWLISTTSATSGAVTFSPTTDSILQIPTGNAAFQISITTPVTGDHGAGSTFIIDNTGNNQPITVAPVSGQTTMTVRGANATTVTIPANNIGEFVWTSATNFRLLYIAPSPT